MRKITSLLMLFCAFVGTAFAQVTDLSQLSNDKIYAIRSARCFLLYSAANADKLSTSTATAITDAAERVANPLENANQQFKIQKTDDKYYLYSVGASKYLSKDGSLSAKPVDTLEITDVKSTYPKYPWKLCVGGNGLNTQIANQKPTGIIINTYTTTDAGNSFQIFEIEDWPLVQATDELSSLVSETKNTFINTLNSKYKETLQTTDANAPFYLSATQDADGNAISKAIDNNSGTFYGSTWQSAAGHPHYWQVDLADAANLEEFSFSYVTRANGSDSPTQINVQGSADGVEFTDIVVLTDLPTAGGATYYSTTIENNGYRYLRFEVPSTKNNYSPGTGEVTIAIAEFSLYNAPYTPHDNTVNNAIIAAEAVLNADNNTLQSVQTAIEEFNAALVLGQCTVNYNFTYNENVKYVQTAKSFVGEEYPAITIELPYGVSAVKPAGVIEEGDVPEGTVTKTVELTISQDLPFVTAANVNSITKWYYVRMHTNQPGYLGDIAEDNSINVARDKVSNEYNEDYLWGFAGNVFDGITVVNKGTGKQLTSAGSGNATLTDNGTAFFVAHTTETTANATNGFCLRKNDSNNYLNANYQNSKLSHWASTDAGSTMFLSEYKETEVEVSAADYATLYLGQATYIPAGVEVYAVTGVEGNWATMTAVEGVLPANTGVILKNAGTYTFKAAAATGSAVGGNLLRGSVEDTYVEGTAYVLGNKEGVVGLYKAELNKDAEGAEGTTHFLNNAGKAYLVLPVAEPTQVIRFNFGGNTTAIESVVNGLDLNAPIYDLSGRRVNNATKGIYIQNGKKFIVK